jgi:hypothetical protein
VWQRYHFCHHDSWRYSHRTYICLEDSLRSVRKSSQLTFNFIHFMAAFWAVYTFGDSGPAITTHGSLDLKQEIQEFPNMAECSFSSTLL